MKSKRNVVHIIHELSVGGVEVAILSSIKLLNEKYNLRIFVIGKIDSTLLSDFNDCEKNIFVEYNYSLLLLPYVILKVISDIIKFSPDMVIGSLWKSSVCLILLKIVKRRIIYVSFIHSTKFFHFLDRIFTSLVIRYISCIFVDSMASRLFVIKQSKSANPHIVSVIIEKAIPQMRTFYNTVNIRMLFVGRINKVKNLTAVIKQIKNLRDYKNLNIGLDLFGPDDGDLKNVLSAVKEYNLDYQVNYFGEISPSKRFQLYKQYNFYIQFSSFEGMAISVVEAMSNGLVCIVTPVGEIANYSKNMVSAVHINFEDNLSEKMITDYLYNVLTNIELCESIGKQATLAFSSQLTYRESIYNNIENAFLSNNNPSIS